MKFRRKKHTTSRIYYILLLVVCAVMIGGFFFTPDSVTNTGASAHQHVLIPSSCTQPDSDTRVYEITGVTWSSYAPTLLFYSRHQTVQVDADGQTIYTRALSEDSILSTTGRSCEVVTVPAGTARLTITLVNCTSGERITDPTFYQGNGVSIFRAQMLGGGFPLLISFLNVMLGIIMLTYWLFVHRWAYVSKSLLYLGIFTTELGLWFCIDTEVCMLLFENAVYRSYFSRLLLLLMCIPFVMFVRHYLHADDKFLYRLYLWLDIFEIAAVLFLQITQIADLSHTLLLTHLMMLLGILYFLYSIFVKFRRREFSRSLWICAIGSVWLILGYSFDIHAYYSGTHDFSVTGRLALFLFLLLLAIDTALVSLREIETGRKATLYRELAEKDLLTGCYSRNAFQSDVEKQLGDTSELILVTFDLNNLKYYNDRFGHDCGDRYIVSSVQIMQKVFSSYGKLYRMGGDEFTLLIQKGSSCDMEKLRKEFQRAQNIYNLSEKEFHMQIACGYARFDPQIDHDLEDLQKRADALMYADKRRLKES